ncbi:MAG TPA: carboxymuconolactone decarboxylase family protein [Terriglobia bacterium]|nr:carboxymuconolactone decarboxylase family protein [Terriglobia bacterium]
MPFKVSAALAASALVLMASLYIGAQAPDTSNLNLAGDRFKPLTWDQMSPEQRTMTMNLLTGPRRGLGGPFNVLLRSPEMGDLAQKFGEYARFRPAVPPKLRELAIIVTARHWTSHYEWYAHRRAAAQEGLKEEIITAIANRKRPTGMQPDEEAVYNFATELLETKQVTDATFKGVLDRYGEKGVVDIVGVMGYYQLVSMLLNVDRYPLPAGAQPELK